MLVTVLFVVMVIGALSLGFLQEGLGDRTAVDHHEASLRALELAQVGLLRAEMELMAQVDPDADGMGTLCGAYASGVYDVTAVQDATHSDVWRLTAVGTYRLSRRTVKVGLSLPRRGLFQHAAFGDEGVSVGGNPALTDAYDSRLGTYASQVGSSDAYGAFALAQGHVGSNADISVNGAVRGDAKPGVTGTTSVGGSGHVSGDLTSRAEPYEPYVVPSSVFEAAYLENDNDLIDTSDPKVTYDPVEYTLDVNGGTLYLAPGTYFFTELRLSSSSVLSVSGPTRLYVTGEVLFTGGSSFVNTTLLPENLVLFVHPYDIPAGHPFSSRTAVVSGGTYAAFALHAPAVPVSVTGSGTLYGGIVGRSVLLGGAGTLHYDLALADWPLDGERQPEYIFWFEDVTMRR